MKKPHIKINIIAVLKDLWKFSDIGGWYKGAVADVDYHFCPTCLCLRFKGEMYDSYKGKFGYNESFIKDEEYKNQDSHFFHDYTYGDQTWNIIFREKVRLINAMFATACRTMYGNNKDNEIVKVNDDVGQVLRNNLLEKEDRRLL